MNKARVVAERYSSLATLLRSALQDPAALTSELGVLIHNRPLASRLVESLLVVSNEETPTTATSSQHDNARPVAPPDATVCPIRGDVPPPPVCLFHSLGGTSESWRIGCTSTVWWAATSDP